MYTEQQFSIPKLHGLSAKTIEEHIKLYSGYVKNANTVLEKIKAYSGDESKTYELGELYRRFTFEYNGMRNHECYFKLLEQKSELSFDSALSLALQNHFTSVDAFKERLMELAGTRGIGWAMLSWEPKSKALLLHWVDEQHVGQLQGTMPIIAIDLWEHSYTADYFPSGKKQYVADFIAQMNWKQAEANFEAAKSIA